MALLNALSVVWVILINFLANYLPIGGITTGEVSDSLPNLFAPAGVTFAIWGLIYLLLAGLAVYLLFPGLLGRERNQELVRRVGFWFIAGNVFNSLWIFAWHNMQIGLSLLLIVAVFLTTAVVYLRLQSFSVQNLKERVFVQWPFRIYFGWLTVAVIANVFSFVAHVQWDGFGLPSAFWTAALIAAAVIIGYWMLQRFQDIPYIAVLIWALLGIIIKRVEAEPQVWSVVITAAAGIVILAAAGARLYWQNQET